jgi:hypothetical protein
MPAEIRHIVFCPAEVAAAIRQYRRDTGRPLPAGALRRLDMQIAGSGVRAVVDLMPDDGSPPGIWEIGNAELTDAVIRYCKAHGIPLPAAGTKGLQCFGDSLLLIVTMNLRGAGWPLSAGLSRPAANPA